MDNHYFSWIPSLAKFMPNVGSRSTRDTFSAGNYFPALIRKLIPAQVFYFCKIEHLVMLSQRNIYLVIINNMVSRHLITIKEMKMIRT
jgi:hypothetical protein